MFITKLDGFLFVNKWEINITFNPEFTGDAALFDLYMDGVLLPEFDPNPEYYNDTLPHGSITVPEITVTRFDYDATLYSSEADSLQDMTKIVVTAEDGKNTKTYSTNFTVGTNELMGVIAPGEVIPENTATDTITYSANVPCDLEVNVKSMSNGIGNAYTRVQILVGANTIVVKLFVRVDIPLAKDACRSTVSIVPGGRPWNELFQVIRFNNFGAVSFPTNAKPYSYQKNARLTVPPIRLLMHCGLSIRKMQTFLFTIYSYRKYWEAKTIRISAAS